MTTLFAPRRVRMGLAHVLARRQQGAPWWQRALDSFRVWWWTRKYGAAVPEGLASGAFSLRPGPVHLPLDVAGSGPPRQSTGATRLGGDS